MRSPKETHDKGTAVTDHSRATPMPCRHVACQRCRRRKQRCDGLMPACANCCRAGVECVQGVSSSQVSRNHLHYLENLVRELESQDRTGPVALPSTAGDNDSTSTAAQQISLVEPVYPVELHNDQPAQKSHEHIRQPQLQSPSVSLSGSMAQDQPLAQEAGLLSLANASDPKYLGPSSGFPYARLIYASAPQSQGLSLSFRNHPYESNDSATAFVPDAHSAALPPIAECQQYAEAFFEVTLFLPFMLHDDVFVLIDHLHGFISAGTWSHRMPVTIAFSQVFLLLSIGARHLETKLKAKFDSSKLYASGMQYANRVTLYDSVEGVQTLLLITLDSFYNPKGLNAWFLLHTIISSCLDMGLQRRENYQRDTESDEQRKRRYLRSGIFWSAYSLDRTLTTTLGRPLTLRDEAIDVDFPGVDHGFEVEMGALEWAADNSRAIEAQMQPYVACIYKLRFDRIVAEIKLMLYRVSRSPRRFPWPADITRWQHEVEASCRALLEEVERRQRGRQVETLNPISLPAVQKLQLKYHQCLMLLHRPSPQNPRPGREATQTCFNSALKIIRISADLHRFTNMDCTWLAAHSIFVAAVTIFYCLWTNPDGIPLVTPTGCLEGLETAHELLKYLSETWSVANDACEKLSSLLPVAKEVHDMFFGVASYPANYQTAGDSQGHPHSAARKDGLNNDRQMEYWPSQGTSALVDELGVLRELFDLEWLDNVNLDTIPPAE